jgi:hypothetical protein
LLLLLVLQFQLLVLVNDQLLKLLGQQEEDLIS